MTKSAVPTPETKTVLIESAGYPYQRTTIHTYVETRETEIGGPRGEAYEFIFKCNETNVTRRYGLVDRFVFKGMEDDDHGN